VGGFALRYAENMAGYRKKSAVCVRASKDNKTAVDFYLKCGYEITGENIYTSGDGISREGYEFKKNILPAALT
jgi:hypothetical protein